MALAALSALAPFTATFAPALTPFAASFAALAWRALGANFAAFGSQFRLDIAAAFAQAVSALALGLVVDACARSAITAPFTGRALTVGALAAFGTLSAWGSDFTFSAFNTAFTTAPCFTWGANFSCCPLASLAAATIATAPAAITAAFFASFSGFVIFKGSRCSHGLSRCATEQVFQPAKEAARHNCCRCHRGCC